MSNTNATIVPQDREATIRRWRTEAKAWVLGADADRVKERISAWLDENHITATSVYAERKVG